MIVAQPNSDDRPPQRREGEVIRIDEPWRGDPTMTGPPPGQKRGVLGASKEQHYAGANSIFQCSLHVAARWGAITVALTLAASKLKGER